MHLCVLRCVFFGLAFGTLIVMARACGVPDISGVPGTGKTATVHAVVRELKRMAEQNVRICAFSLLPFLVQSDAHNLCLCRKRTRSRTSRSTA